MYRAVTHFAESAILRNLRIGNCSSGNEVFMKHPDTTSVRFLFAGLHYRADQFPGELASAWAGVQSFGHWLSDKLDDLSM
jgi:hypothetical protein